MPSALKARAAREGLSLSGFLKREVGRIAERPTMREWLERTQQAKPVSTKRTSAQLIRELRDRRVIVLGASVLVELLTNVPRAGRARRDLEGIDELLIVPHLLDVEVASVLRNLAAGAIVRRSHSAATE
jgi:hypothetical protein